MDDWKGTNQQGVGAIRVKLCQSETNKNTTENDDNTYVIGKNDYKENERTC